MFNTEKIREQYTSYNMRFPYKVYTSVKELYEAMKPYIKNT
jgi:hypothetical protein